MLLKMAEVKVPVRVLQSGKVYRQMFDAEVQLMESFSATKSKLQQTTEKSIVLPELGNKNADFSKSDTTNTTSDRTTFNILTSRQKMWASGMPNDSTTENPVLHRQITDETTFQLQDNETNFEVCEVRGLPNVLHVTKKDSNIIEKISEKRKERHDKALDEMHHDLSLISTRMEPRITSIGENVKKQLKDDDLAIDEHFSTISSNETLVNFSYNQLEALWDEVARHSPSRRQAIENVSEWLNQVEDERLDTISSVLRSYTTKLEKIASLPRPSIHRLIENEAMMINQSALANRRAFAKLTTNLLESDIAREVTQHRAWSERVKDWRKLNAELAVRQFSDFMKTEEIRNSPDINAILDALLAEQKELSLQRQNIIEQLKEFKPPSSTKQAVYQWNTALTKVHESIDKLNMRMVQKLHQKYEATCQMCLMEIEKYKQNLLISKVCDEEDMQRIVNDHLLPQVGDQLKAFEKKLGEMDVHIEELAISSEQQLKSLFKFAQETAHLWDVHVVGMAKQERNLQEEMEQARQDHDVDNQEREMKLDVNLDKLRQENSDEALAASLEQCMSLLQYIKEGYEEFHGEQLKKVAEYPGMVERELQRYDGSVCKFFSVDRHNPTERATILEDEEELPKQKKSVQARKSNSVKKISSKLRAQSSHRLDQQNGSPKKLKRQLSQQSCTDNTKAVKTKGRGKKKSRAIEEESEPEVEKIVRETLTSDKGTTFYVIAYADVEEEDDTFSSKKELCSEESTFMTDFENTHFQYQMPDYIQNVYLDPAYIKDIKSEIRMLFLNHMEKWKDESLRSAEVLAKDKCEELASELDLRLHLHAPRARRIEVDVRNVRAAELVLHKERVNRHCRGITAALESLKHDFVHMTRQHDDEAAEFKSRVEKMEEVYTSATKCTKLKELTEDLHMDLATYVQNIKISLRTFRRTLDNTLGRLRESNAQCVRSFKLFCEGGNFSPEETIPLRKKLEKIAQRVDHAEGAVMRDLEGMESKRIEQAADHVNKFEEKFRNHLMDMTFIESMQRWATNSQVRIKTEVEHSNGMGAVVVNHLATLRRRIDACERPNLDKESVTPKFLHSYVREIMDSLHKRSAYLNCHLSDTSYQQANMSNSQIQLDSDGVNAETSQDTSGSSGGVNRPSSSRKTHTREDIKSRQGLDTQSSVGKGRQVTEDAAIGLIKNILRAQKGKNFVDADDMRSTATGASRPPLSTTNSVSGFGTRPQRSYQRQVTLASIAGSVSDSEPSRKATADGLVPTVYKRRETKFEPKYMVFGVKPPEGSFFMAKVCQILYETLDGMLSTAEIYYKQKGPRMATRPQYIQESFDVCAEAVGEKLGGYEKQAEEFHNASLQKFRQVLRDFEYEICHVARLVLSSVLDKEMRALREDQEKMNRKFDQCEEAWESQKKSNKHSLRTTMGHPDQKAQLSQLSEIESRRQEEHVAGIEEHASSLEDNVRLRATEFSRRLSTTSNQLLKEFDSLLTVDDVIVGRVPPRKEPTAVLMRRRAEGYGIADVTDPSFGETSIVERGANSWPPCNFKLLNLSKRDNEQLSRDMQEPLCTEHTTLPQVKTSTYRDEILRQYLSAHQEALDRIRVSQSERLQKESRWKKNWSDCLENVKKLYR